MLDSLATLLPNEDSMINKPEWTNKGIDLILGADAFEEIIGRRMKKRNPLMAQETQLSWILSGEVPVKENQVKTVLSNISTIEFNRVLQQLFDSDSLPEDISLNNECEIMYQSSVIIQADGRYAVTLPFKEDKTMAALGNCKNRAFVYCKQLERRLDKDPPLHEEYHKAISEYIELGHMENAIPFVGEDRNVIRRDSSFRTLLQISCGGKKIT